MTKKRKGYIYVEVEESVRVDTCDIIGDIEDDELLDELKSRKLIADDKINPEIPKEGAKLRKLLCDILDLSYHSSDANILDGIKERLV